MSKTVDDRVVQMRFDNKQFESNVQTSMNTLEKLKQSLKLKDASKGFDEVGSAARRLDLSPLSNGVESVKMKFSALEVMAVTALANITNSALNAGKRIVSALTIDPIKTGLQEYETKINAIQVIKANTRGKNTMEEITAALDELNTYADKTIYNFAQMTSNIGKFTAQGLDVKQAANAVQGLANLAAASGASAEDMSRATYQMSQALGGTIRKIDWNSLRNANMATTTLKDTLIDVAKVIGKIDVRKMMEDGNKAFEDTLENGWLSGELFTEAMNIYSGIYSEAELKAKGFTDDQIKNFIDLAKTAESAATEVKTFTQLWDVLKETAQSGWTQSWEYIIGDFDTAKRDLTALQVYFSDLINASSDARNKILKEWADGGGRTMLIESFKNVWNSLLGVIRPIKKALEQVFPPMTSERLLKMTKALQNFTSKLKVSGATAGRIRETFHGIFSILNIVKKVLVGVGKGFATMIGGTSGVGSFLSKILEATAAVGRFFSSLDKGFDSKNFDDLMISIGNTIGDFVKMVGDKIKNLGEMFPSVAKGIAKAANFIWNAVKTVFSTISEKISVGDIFAGLAGGGIFVVAKKLAKVIDTVKDAIDGFFNGKMDDAKTKFSDILESVHNSLESFTTGLKVSSIVGIAVAVGILASSMRKISDLNPKEIGSSLIAIGALLAMLNASLKSMTKTLMTYDSKGVIKASVSLMLMATALRILAGAMEKISKLSMKEIAKGLIGVGGGLAGLVAGIKVINGVKIPLRTSISILALAEACKILGDAMEKFSEFTWDEIARGLVAMGGALAELVASVSILNKFSGFSSIFGAGSILIVIQGLGELADALKKFGEMAWDEIGKGLAAMGGALLEVSLACGALGKLGGFSSIFGAGSILIVIQGLGELADALKQFGAMNWGEIGRGLSAMGGALAEVVLACGGLSAIAGFSSLFGAGAIFVVIQGLDDLSNALKQFGGMSWSEIGKGLAAMGGALLEVSLFSGALGAIAGFSGLLGGGAILLTIQGLSELSDSLKKFSEMSWCEIYKGITAMGAALGVIAFGNLANAITGLAGLIGSSAIRNTTKGLGDLADALKKFGQMNWGEIGRGLTAMIGALSVLAVGTLANALSGIVGLLGGKAINETVKGLGDLADALQKFGEMNWGEIGRGLTAMMGALAVIAVGDLVNILSIFGSFSVSIIAKPLNDLADALKKFGEMEWEEIKKGLAAMGGALAEISLLAGVIGGLTNVAGLLGGGTIWLTTQGLSDLADALEKFGNMSWDEIEKGLKAMAGALSVIAIGSLANILSIIGAFSIAGVAAPLNDLADALKKFGQMNWDEIQNGLKAMGGALLEVSLFTGALGKIAGLSGLLGAGTIYVSTKGLGDLADALKKFGEMSWDEIERGMKAMGGALAEVSLFSGALGLIAGFSGLLGGASILITVQGLGKLADGLKKFGDMSWNKTERGLKAMGAALGVIAAGNLLNSISGLAGAFGGLSILTTVQGLSDLADGLKKFGDMSWDEIEKGLKAMGAALGEVALGGLLNSLSGLGADAIAKVAKPLGDLADSVSKWKDVTVPEGLGEQIASLAGGIFAFTFDGLGASALADVAVPLGDLADSIVKWEDVTVPEGLGENLKSLANGVFAFTFDGLGVSAITDLATPLGDLSDSVKKWIDVTVPEGLGEQLRTLANGVFAFTFSGLGASAIAEVAVPLGNLSDSVKKWIDVTVPEGLGEQLSALAIGVESFTFGGFGASAIADVAVPLGDLANSVSKWKDVTVPEGLDSQLTSLANGVKAFSWAFLGSLTLDTLTTPLGDLATAVKKWNGVSIPDGLEEQLSSLANGVEAFSWAFLGTWTLESLVGPLGDLATAVKKWNGIQISEDVAERLKNFGDSVVSFADDIDTICDIDSTSIVAFANSISNLKQSVNGLNDVNIAKINAFVSTIKTLDGLTIDVSALSTSLSSVSIAVQSMMISISSLILANKSTISSAMNSAMSGMANAVRASQSAVTSAMHATMNGMVNAVRSSSSKIIVATNAMVNKFVSTIRSKKEAANSAFKELVSGAASAIKTQFDSFVGAGIHLGNGLVQGIEAREQAAYDAGYALGQAAVQGEKDGQQSQSPSKLTIKAGKWLGEGLVIGMNKMGNSVYKTGKSMGSKAVESISGALSKASNMLDNNLEMNPKIRPVVDMNNINGINFSFDSTINASVSRPVNSLSRIISDAQAEVNASNRDVVRAVTSLREDLNNLYTMVDGKDFNTYLDSKKVSSILAKPMNRELSSLSKRGAY